MNKQTKNLAKSAIVLIVLSGLVYSGIRLNQISSMQKELDAMTAKGKDQTVPEEEMDRLKIMFPVHADVSSVVEELYSSAGKLDLDQVAIITGQQTVKPVARGSRTNIRSAKILSSYPLKITFEGRYRDIARFVQYIQDMERYKRIVSLEMKPGKTAIKASIMIEVVSFEVRDAA